jgi:DNA-binding HxlR family transcriptional regulator
MLRKSLVSFGLVSRRTYHQPECGLAVALDLLGERWTLLIVRELLMGPQRYSDLHDALDGISTNLLAERLKHLETVGIAERGVLPPPAASVVYRLTPSGRQLEPVVIELARWGHQFTSPGESFDPRRTVFAMKANFHAAPAESSGPVHLHVDGHTLGVMISHGELLAQPYPMETAAASVTLCAETLRGLMCGAMSIASAIEQGRAAIHGDVDAATTVVTAIVHV